MGKKNKKSKGRGAEKAAQKLAKKDQKGEGMENLESLIAEFQQLDRKKTTFSEEKSSHPSPRSSMSVTAHPDKDELILFGGEYYNGHKTFMYNDLFVYNCKKNEWCKQFVPNPPAPRCAHQAVAVSKEGGQLWVFGGEFASPNNAQFHHYKDLWVLNLKLHKWEQVKSPHGPSQRSGHRMIAYKRSIFVFGGFQECHKNFIYFNDCYLFDLSSYAWTKVTPSGTGPSPRSACQLAVTPKGILVVGGYSKVRVKKDVDKGTAHVDMFLLSDEADTKFKWVQVRDAGQKPWPRSGFSLCQIAPNRAVMFGGVCDEEDDDDDLESIFFNSLHCLDLSSYRWFTMDLRKSKPATPQTTSVKTEDATDEDDQIPSETSESSTEVASSSKTTVILPCGRMNSLTAIKRNVLFVYGGMFEDDDKQVTLNDLWSIDIKKMDTWQQIVEADDTTTDWFENDDNPSEDDDNKQDVSSDDDVNKQDVSSDDDVDKQNVSSDDEENESGDEKPRDCPVEKSAIVSSTETASAVEDGEGFADYFGRTKEYWLERASDEATEDVRADAIRNEAEKMCNDWFERRSKASLEGS